MTDLAASMQVCNQEFIKCLNELTKRKQNLQETIQKEKKEKRALELEIRKLQAKLDAVNHSLEKQEQMLKSHEEIIKESEMGYKTIFESSQILLNLVKVNVAAYNSPDGSHTK